MNSTSSILFDGALEREFLLFDRGAASVLFVIDAFAVQEVLPLGRVAKISSDTNWLEARGGRWPVSYREGELLPRSVEPLNALLVGRGADARAMLVGQLHGTRSTLGVVFEKRPGAPRGERRLVSWVDGPSANIFESLIASSPFEAPVVGGGACPLALVATPSEELSRECSLALIQAGWTPHETPTLGELQEFSASGLSCLILIDPSFGNGAGYLAARALKLSLAAPRVAIVSHPLLPLNSAMVEWCRPDWVGLGCDESLKEWLVSWRPQ